MKITTVPFAILGFQYKIARFPLDLIEDGVMARMESEAPARLFYERMLGMLDAAVGSALGDPRLRQRGAAMAERSDALSRAAKLDAAATTKQLRADAELKFKSDKAIKDQKQASDDKEHNFRDAQIRAQERKEDGGESADKRTAAAKKQVDAKAATRAKSVKDARRVEQSRIQAEEKKATSAAETKLDNARNKSQVAESKRVQADRLEQLADTEKLDRRAQRVTDNR
ncbi:IF2 family translation initiation factor [Mycobacterium sp. 236(2023)]|uniref:IF2 family translation initiation factor n=1 Tax=Mycobacterium sp. 236(2023) TaxID=3038163 RepID=UPI00241579DD|nr:IF2 family translation initiation factor [Mycobacterium sp. 236(2023)]MDG4664524.1 IF2 family translation initiation factor [Mycobacterium sp. 236(2023)]